MKRFFLAVVASLMALTLSAQELNVGSFNIRWLAKGDYKQHNSWDAPRRYAPQNRSSRPPATPLLGVVMPRLIAPAE